MQNNSVSFIRANHLSKKVRSGDTDITILENVNLNIGKGESVAILGTSGSGKTTLLTLLAGLDLPTTGDIFFDTQNMAQLNEDARALLRSKYVGFIFQSFNLIPTMTALENVMLPLEIQYASPNTAKKLSIAWLHKVGLGERIDHYPLTLSGGEQQRVAIARAFVTNPIVVFADEMTGNLDSKTGEQVIDLLFELNLREHTTLVLVTHDQKLAVKCQRRLLLENGTLRQC